jgi:hypothetical protein
VEATVQALLEAVENSPPQRIRLCDLQTLINSLKLRKACGIDDIPNECLRHLPRRPLVHLTHLFNHCLWLSHFSKPWKEAKVITLPKPGKDSKFSQNIRPISLLSTTSKLFEKVILNIVQKHIEERGLLKASQYGFRARHSTTLQYTRLTVYVTISFNNMSTAAEFLDIKNSFDITWHSGLLCKLSKLEFSTSLIKLISSFLSQRRFSVSVRNIYTKGNASRGAPRFGPVTFFVQHVYKWCPQTPGVYLALSPYDTCLYAADRKVGFVVRKLQRGLSSMETWCEGWNIKLMKIRLRGFTFPAVIDRLSPILH